MTELTSVPTRLRRPLLQVGSILLGAIVWELVGRAGVSFLFPPLTDVVSALGELIRGGELLPALGASLKVFAVGLAISLVAGLGLGVAMGLSRSVRMVFGTYVDLLMTVPPIAWVPLVLLWLGPSPTAQGIVVVTFTFPGLVILAEQGVRTVDPQLTDMGRAFGYRRGKLLRHVIVPGGLPLILTGIRIAAARAVKGIVTAEVLIAATGLGGMLETYGSRLNGAKVYAIILSILIAAIALSEAIRFGERRVLHWQDV